MRSITRYVLGALAMLSPLSVTTSLAAERWEQDYLEALDLLSERSFEPAAARLALAAEARPQPAIGAIDGEIDYLPYLHLAATRFELGDAAEARRLLAESARHGVARRSWVGRQLWERYALPIMASDDALTGSGAATASFRDFDRQAYVLDEDEAELLRAQVLRRVAPPGDDGRDMLPWYFHYEYGLELLDAGDPQRALDELILAAGKRETSARKSRMYGMWFVNYLPYYRIAQAHSQLGNWRCAMDAMRLSARYGEFSPADRGFEDYSDLQKLILRQVEEAPG